MLTPEFKTVTSVVIATIAHYESVLQKKNGEAFIQCLVARSHICARKYSVCFNLIVSQVASVP